MTPYRARSCPKCQYYVGYAVTKPFQEAREAAVKSFCLNCNYRLPMRAVVSGMKASPRRRSGRRPTDTIYGSNDLHASAALTAPSTTQIREASAEVANYSRDLRAIGQELEKRRFTTFNLKCSGDAYFVWSTEIMAPSLLNDLSNGADVNGAEFGYENPTDPTVKMLLDRIVGFHYSAADVERLEHAGAQNRRGESGVSDGRCLSQLLRTVGEQVNRRNHRLLAIAWQERQIGVVAEIAGGRREMLIQRSDNLYDLWVRMYLQRSH
jgi:hypothetical protein